MTLLRFLFGAPSADWIRFGVFFAGIVLFISIAEKMRSYLNWSPEVTRKLVHILTGILIFFTPYFFILNKTLIWMALIFIVVNFLGVRTGKLQGMHSTERRSYGTVFYPITFLFLVMTCWEAHKTVMMLSILILAVSDAAAAIVGENLRQPHEYRLGKDKKSFEGSCIMFLTSLLIVLVLLPLIDHLDGRAVPLATAGWIGLCTAVVATAMEAVSRNGSDNLSAPLGAAFTLHFMFTHSTRANVSFTFGIGLALIVAYLSYRARFLTASGSMGIFILAALIFGVGGWVWSVPILTFFVLSSILSKIGKVRKEHLESLFEKSSRRDMGQVSANGAIAGCAMLLYNFFPGPLWYPLYLGALAAVNADTWATEIGVFSKWMPRSVKDFRKVPHGTSGGITLLGTVGALAGASVIAFSGRVVSMFHSDMNILPLYFWIIVAGGFFAHLVDSLLGATLQAQYRCSVCGKTTEKRTHCQENTALLSSGFKWLNNDAVNAACALSGLFIVWIGVELL